MIRPYRLNPRYWEYQGKPLMLLGGSVEDNLFQIDQLEEHLDLLQAVGGNYIRCTMSSRDDGDVWPFARDGASGLFDLQKFNSNYWEKFGHLLELTAKREIIVQVEVWDRFDFSREPWLQNPFNPAQNINYTSEESGLKEEYPNHPGANQQPFFYSVPACQNNQRLLRFQQDFVQQLLSITFQFDHVLYCMDNETSGTEEWGAYWADFIHEIARRENKEIYLTEMWDQWDVTHAMHDATFNHPERYGFADISQNNQISGEDHWHNMQWRRASIADAPRPMNMVKIYGADGNKFGRSNDDAMDRFWRGLLGGMASLRFHRPPSGLGLSPLAQKNIKMARSFLSLVDFLQCSPDVEHTIFRVREEDGAYLSQYGESDFAIYFPRKAQAELNLPNDGKMIWFNLLSGNMIDEDNAILHNDEPFTPPDEGHWLALIRIQATAET